MHEGRTRLKIVLIVLTWWEIDWFLRGSCAPRAPQPLWAQIAQDTQSLGTIQRSCTAGSCVAPYGWTRPHSHQGHGLSCKQTVENVILSIIMTKDVKLFLRHLLQHRKKNLKGQCYV